MKNHIAMQNSDFLDARLAGQIIQTGELHHDDENVFGQIHIMLPVKKWNSYINNMVLL